MKHKLTLIGSIIVLTNLIALVQPARSSELRAAVKYVSTSMVYLDQGRASGVQQGDSGKVIRDNITIASLEVIHIADNSSACRVLVSDGEIRVGDVVRLEISFQPEDSTTIVTSPLLIPASPLSENKYIATKPRPRSRFRGRANIQFYTQHSRNGFDFTQPSLFLSTETSDILGSGIGLNIRMRARQTKRVNRGTESDNRFYEVSIRRNLPDENLSWGIGRLTFSRAPGVGYLDGAVLEYRLSRTVDIGGFLGADPDWGGGGTRWNYRKYGVSSSYTNGDWSSHRIASTVALVGSYKDNAIDREFIYLGNDLVLNPKISVYQSAELEINRDWRRKVEGKALKLSGLLASLRWQISNKLNLTLGYDNHSPYRDIENSSTPDSIFDDALRQGARFGMAMRLSRNLRFGFDTGLKTVTNDKSTGFATGYFSLANTLGTRINTTARLSVYSSPFNEGWQPSISLSRTFGNLDLNLQSGMNSYKMKQRGNGSISSNWIRFSTDYWVNRWSYGSASYEIQQGDGSKTDRILVSVGIRI